MLASACSTPPPAGDLPARAAAPQAAASEEPGVPQAEPAAVPSDTPPIVPPPSPPVREAPPLPSAVPTSALSEPETSPLEEKRLLAGVLRPRVESIAESAKMIDRLFSTYIARCYDRYSGRRWTDRGPSRRRHEWLFIPIAEFAWQDRWVIPLGSLTELGTDPERCRDDWAELAAEAGSVGVALEDVQDRSRRLGILPGHLRDLLDEHGLER